MEILIITSEIAPFSGQSGLSALAAALPKGLRGLGHHAMVVSPLYGCVDPTTHSLARRLSTLEIEFDGEKQKCILFDGRTTGGIDLLFIGHPVFGDGPETDDSEAAQRNALVLSQAAVVLAAQLEAAPEVVHAVGFQAALALPLSKSLPNAPITVLSPVRLDQQGRLSADLRKGFAAGGKVASVLSEDPADNLLAAGFRAADRIVFDSQGSIDALAANGAYADLHAALGERPTAIKRVLLGLDSAYWNPLTDSHLAARYDPADTSGKDDCKATLQYELGLAARPDTALVAAVDGALDTDDHATLEALLRNDTQVVVGVKGTPSPALQALCEAHEDKLKCLDVSDEDALHRVVSGADFLWLSRNRPAESLLHLTGLRYGALPIVAAVGSAAEVVVDCDQQLTTGNGFVFTEQASELSALQRAIAAFGRGDDFEALRLRAMRNDVTWDRTSRHFDHIYRDAIDHKAV